MSAADDHERFARRYLVSGHVQGVGFRWFVREQARALGIAGVVRNKADGAVVVDALASSSQLARLEEALRRGPIGATVDRVEVVPVPTESETSRKGPPFPFTIARGE